MGIIIIGSSVVLAALLYLGLTISSKVIAKKASSTGSSAEVKVFETSIEALNQNIDKAIAYATTLVPLSEYTDLVKKKDEFEDTLANAKNKLETLESRLSEIQGKVSVEELNHSSLKKGREEAIDLANSIREKKAQLESEQKRLSEELNNSKNQLDILSNEMNLTPEQEAGLNQIKTALKNSQEQLNSLSQTYKQSSTRFATLHGQYSDLEKEFTKLVEKDLSGEEDEEEEE